MTSWRYPRRDVTDSTHTLMLVGKVYSESMRVPVVLLCILLLFDWKRMTLGVLTPLIIDCTTFVYGVITIGVPIGNCLQMHK